MQIGASERFILVEEVASSYLARSDGGVLTLLTPLEGKSHPLARATGGVRLRFEARVDFAWAGRKFDAPAALLSCDDPALATTFTTLARDVATRMGAGSGRPSGRQVLSAVQEWEALLRSRRMLTVTEQVGLWGELWFLRHLPDVDAGLAAWHGPDASTIDFIGGGIGVELKTSFQELEHHFTYGQLARPLGERPTYVVSLWVEQDDVIGRTLPELVDDLTRMVTNSARLERQLLKLGYSRADSATYSVKLAPLQHPLWFPVEVVPRVRTFDPGVSQIGFTSLLDRAAALSPARGIALTAKLVGASGA